MVENSCDYEVDLLERLKDAEFAAGYLNAALEDADERFLTALRQVAAAHGMANLSEMARQAISALSDDDKPRPESFQALLTAMGLLSGKT